MSDLDRIPVNEEDPNPGEPGGGWYEIVNGSVAEANEKWLIIVNAAGNKKYEVIAKGDYLSMRALD